jgi:4-hydroxy-tetrahydrodipicolinate reductase
VTRLVICGIRGRMGSTLARLAAAQADVRVVAGLARVPLSAEEAEELGCDAVVGIEEAAGVIADADVVIDFSGASGTALLLQHGGTALRDRALVVGTTGLEQRTQQQLDALARMAAVLTAANFSIGVNLLVVLAERAAAVLDASRYDAEVVEVHHGRKRDAPSGTALALGEAVARGRAMQLDNVRRDGRSGDAGARPAGEIGFHAVRGGGVVGEHQLLFLGQRERIELGHQALDRSLFAEGALAAALWLAGRPAGRYAMRDVLGF